MKPSTIFWGSLLIFFGIFFLFSNLNIFYAQMGSVIDFWPILLIIWGVSLLKIPLIVKNIMAAVSAAFISLLIVGAISHIWNFGAWQMGCDDEWAHNIDHFATAETRTMVIDYEDKIQTASLNFKGGAGEFDVGGYTDKLIFIKSEGPECGINTKEDSTNIDIDFSFDKGKSFLRYISSEREALLRLNSNVMWDLKFKIGASEFDCDLREYKVSSLDIDAGAADIDVMIGDLSEETNINVDAGASNVEISVPKTAGCMIKSKTGLSNRDFFGFVNKDGVYYSEGYDSAKAKIFIDIKGGVSNFQVDRYENKND